VACGAQMLRLHHLVVVVVVVLKVLGNTVVDLAQLSQIFIFIFEQS